MDTSSYRHQESSSYDEDGEWFTGTNAMGDSTWDTRCRVVVADRSREFTFLNHGHDGRHEMVRWGFHFRLVEDGRTEVTQSWEVLPSYPEGLGLDDERAGQVLDMMKGLALQGMPETLAAFKRDAESGAEHRTGPPICSAPTVRVKGMRHRRTASAHAGVRMPCGTAYPCGP